MTFRSVVLRVASVVVLAAPLLAGSCRLGDRQSEAQGASTAVGRLASLPPPAPDEHESCRRCCDPMGCGRKRPRSSRTRF